MSDLRETDHGLGRFVLCIRGVESKYRQVGTYAVFFDNNDYKASRMSVMIDDCQKQDYRPCPLEGCLSWWPLARTRARAVIPQRAASPDLLTRTSKNMPRLSIS